jgi:hypothetical protein
VGSSFGEAIVRPFNVTTPNLFHKQAMSLQNQNSSTPITHQQIQPAAGISQFEVQSISLAPNAKIN